MSPALNRRGAWGGLGACSTGQRSRYRSGKTRPAGQRRTGIHVSSGAAPGDGGGARGQLGNMLQALLLLSFVAFLGVMAVLKPFAFWVGVASFAGALAHHISPMPCVSSAPRPSIYVFCALSF